MWVKYFVLRTKYGFPHRVSAEIFLQYNIDFCNLFWRGGYPLSFGVVDGTNAVLYTIVVCLRLHNLLFVAPTPFTLERRREGLAVTCEREISFCYAVASCPPPHPFSSMQRRVGILS